MDILIVYIFGLPGIPWWWTYPATRNTFSLLNIAVTLAISLLGGLQTVDANTMNAVANPHMVETVVVQTRVSMLGLP